MGTRRTITPEDIHTALTAGLVELDRVRSQRDAIHDVRTALRTTTGRAAEALRHAVLQPGSPLVLLNGSGMVLTPADTWQSLESKDHGWSTELVDHLRFDIGDRLAPIGSRGYGQGPWVALRESLPVWRDRIAAQLAERDRVAAETRQRELTAFQSVHGDALDVVHALMAQVPHPDWATTDDMVGWSNRDSSRFYNTSGSLTLELRGDQIRAFAELVRELATRDAGPTPPLTPPAG